ncbi:hypothetical protein PHLGIDRAFT_70390 [Phlebiopsis gigantea 11061_1 CR5-6]|uniref:TPR-like protein n=1 Tax=Phlebiopsis gigantea (strain 11061_1 CR5-6) TaxID=745531 RepID=A0A0C3S901_PHLG1|nr:hypothetical protein PHLGIDRAFT_70390 [Phlebiopsis gigantea 11061_1 CR5-6]
MASGKDKHYWSQLLATLTAGSWDISLPAKAANGTVLPWSELLRKFNKHCHGYADVAELASQTQALSLLVEVGVAGQDGPSESVAIGEECVLQNERRDEVAAGYNTLKGMRNSDKEPVRLLLAYYAYALDRPAECIAILDEIPQLEDAQRRLAAYETMRVDAPANGTAVSSTTESTASTSRPGSMFASAPRPEDEDGRLWGLTEVLRSTALKGMSLERTHPQDTRKALEVYLTGVSYIDDVVPVIQRSLNTASPQVVSTSSGSFAKFRELWRWSERLLRRAIILTAQTSNASTDESFWALQSTYRACSAHWPPAFRPELRSTVATIHVRAFVLRARELPSDALRAKTPRWISTARSVLQELRALLSVCTHFPKAGERNVRVEDFVDLCVAVWEADGAVGEYAGWAIDFLWWATRLTFNSFRIYRHMFRLLFASGDPELAKRTLRLYIQVVSKVREAGSSQGGTMVDAEGILEWDTDRLWVQTLVLGVKMLCRLAVQEVDHGKAVELAKEAGTVIQKARTRLDEHDKELVASVLLADGIYHSAMVHAVEQDPRTRNVKLAQSFECFTAAVNTHPTASAYHHLALACSRPGPSKDLAVAIEHARAAVEADPNEVRHWHLLGLLLAANGDWQASKQVLELGIGNAEAGLIDDEAASQGPVQANGIAPNLTIRDFVETVNASEQGVDGPAVNGHTNGVFHETILPPTTTTVPPSSTLLQPLGDRLLSNRQEKFEYALQARMTQLALTELVEGAEAVGDKWLEVFLWFREKRPAALDDSDRRVSQDTRPFDMMSTRTQQPIPAAVETKEEPMGEGSPVEMQASIPITITPATPAATPHDATPQASTVQVHVEMSGEKRSVSLDEKDRDISRGKKVREVFKNQVHKNQARITTISKKIGHGVGRHSSINLKRMASAPDFHTVLSHNPYQASSIHLRQYNSIHTSQHDLGLLDVPPPPRAASPDPVARSATNHRTNRDLRLLSDVWLMSAAIFRRLGKIEQAKGAIQEAEVRDEDNPAVWVQLGLYHAALGDNYRAAEAFRKALFIRPNDIPATVYLCRIYLTAPAPRDGKCAEVEMENVDLAAGLLSDLTRGAAWDVPEAWYFLAQAYKLQGRRDRERECLNYALSLSQTRGVRDITAAVGWCL